MLQAAIIQMLVISLPGESTGGKVSGMTGSVQIHDIKAVEMTYLTKDEWVA